MNTLPRPNKSLEIAIRKEVAKFSCPIHRQSATISMPDENKEVEVVACCVFFKKDITTLAERMRKDFLYRDEKRREREERERRKEGNRNN